MGLVTAVEAVFMLGITPSKFIKLLDRGEIVPELEEGRLRYDYTKLRGFKEGKPTVLRPLDFPYDTYAPASEAMSILGISRRTFYDRVNRSEIKLHKRGQLSFVLRTDLYAKDELF